MFKSRIEVREYAMNKAIELMGTGAPGKHVVEKAKEIESYIIGEAELPETDDTYAELKKVVVQAGNMVRSHNEQENRPDSCNGPSDMCLGMKGS